MSVLNLYNGIKTAIETDVTEIKTVRLFNNQYTNENVESSLPWPNALIEFQTIEWESKTGGLQSGSVTLNVHIGFKSLKDEDTDFFAVTQKIFLALDGLATTEHSPLKRISETQDIDHDGFFVWQQTYFIDELLDCDNYVHKDMTTTTATDLELTGELDIDNTKIRTGDGNFD